jgi:lipopolysaccharide export system permease protein
MITVIDRYILRKHVGPFLFAMTTITFIFVMRVLVDFLDLFASRNLGVFTIAETFSLSLGWIFALTFPMSVLVAVVMTFGRLSQDYELDAMHAGGVSFLRILLPVLSVTAVLTVALFVYHNEVLPEANHRLKTLTSDIHRTRPTIAFREQVFIDDFEGYRLLVREVDDEHNIIRDVTVYVLDPREPARTIHAPWGELIYEDDGNRLVIRLHDGEIHEVDKADPGNYFLLNFATHDIIFEDLGTKLERRDEGGLRGDRELSAWEMRQKTAVFRQEKSVLADSLATSTAQLLDEFRGTVQRALAAEDPALVQPSEVVSRARITLRKIRGGERQIERKVRDINRYEVEIHKKFSFPVACLVFVLVGAPLGAWARRGGIGVGGGLSFLFFLLYYVATLEGETLGDRGFLPPAVGMWSINVLLGLTGIALVLRRDMRFPFRRGSSRR